MKKIFLFIILIVSQKILTQENFDFFSENKIYELNDTSFEEITTIGRAYRWLILFYSYTANSEYIDAIKEVKNIFDSYKNLNELRFAQMNVDNNIITKIRLDINKIPNLILLENNTMLEMNSTLNHENMEGFIFTIFSDVKEYLKPLPQKITPTYAKWVIYKKSFDQFLNEFNQDLMNKGIPIQFNIYGFIISVIILVIISFYIMKLIIYFCCCVEDKKMLAELEKLGEKFEERKNEIDNDEKLLNGQEEEEEEVEVYQLQEEDEDEIERKRLEEERKKILEHKKKKKIKKKKKKVKSDGGNITQTNKRKQN